MNWQEQVSASIGPLLCRLQAAAAAISTHPGVLPAPSAVHTTIRSGEATRGEWQRFLEAGGVVSSVRSLLALKSVLFVLLLPGTVAGYVPYRILRSASRLHTPPLTASSLCAALLLMLGLGVLLRCVWDFAAAGRGTLAPVDPPRHLVVCGLYRFTRNPMYNGVLASLVAEAWLFRCVGLLGYAVFVLAGFHLVVVLYEERALERRFGAAYQAYRRAVPRWGFTVRGYRAPERIA